MMRAALLITLVAIACTTPAQPAMAQASELAEVRPALTDPYAFRGGTMLLPLTIEGDARLAAWPKSITLIGENGQSAQGEVIWLIPVLREGRRWWTWSSIVQVVERDPPRQIELRVASQPVALIALPADPSPVWRLNGVVMRPRLLDAPAPPVISRHAGRIELGQRPDAPDPESPFEHWRWVLLAEGEFAVPPDTSRFTPAAARIAQHQTDLWRAGLQRLERIDPSGAQRCRTLLTLRCRDDETMFAAWVSASAALDQLLSSLLDVRKREATVSAEARAWAEAQSTLMVWPQRVYGQAAQLAVTNRSERDAPVQMQWEDERASALDARIGPHALEVIAVPRPATERAAPAGRSALRLIDVGTRESQSFVLPPPFVAARPPGVTLVTLHPLLTLDDVTSGEQPRASADRRTSVQVRRLNGRWEVFFDCRRPRLNAARMRQSLTGVIDAEGTRGLEAVALVIGDDEFSDGAEIELIIPEDGWHRQLRGRNDGMLQVHRRSYEDRWYCRVVLPDAWLPRAPELGEHLQIGFRRTHGDRDTIETSPARAVPWRLDPGRLFIDLSRWDALPPLEE